MAIGINKVSPLCSPSQILKKKNKIPVENIFHTLGQVCQNNECYEIDWWLLTILEQGGENE